MTIITLENQSELNNLSQKHVYVIVNFSADWCGPCKRIYPIFSKYSNSEKYSKICFTSVDVDEVRDISDNMEIEGLPAFVLLERNKEILRFSGANEQDLCNMLNLCCQ